jgi:hypothetical protein
MKPQYVATTIAITGCFLLITPRLYADDKGKKLDKAKDTVERISPTPPKESTSTRRTPELAKPDPSKKPEKYPEPPPPKINKNNPAGDKEVQKGFDEHQKKYKDKAQPNQ